VQRNQREVENGLLAKGFRKDETHHHVFTYWTLEGRKTIARTYTSHGTHQLDSYLLRQMAKQCRLTTPEFLDLVECPMSRDNYELRLREQSIA
jgi:hypothetical protein